MEQLKKPAPKKQPEPDSLGEQKPEEPDEMPQNEEPEKHQTGHQI